MTTLMVPKDKEPFPTLGPQVCDFIEDYLVYGPGDLRGMPAILDPEKRALIYRLYEVYPKGHPNEGKRRFRRAAISLRKGSAKTEFGAWLAAVELSNEGPVRFDGWDANGNPVGKPVNDPYIPLVAYTEEQSDELAYGALKVILEESQISEQFDIGLERIMRVKGDGKCVSLASSPNSRDGARTTWQLIDESHRWDSTRLIRAHRTMMANLPKRPIAEPWMLEITTAYSPGDGSVAESTMNYAREIEAGIIEDPRLFFFHRQASDGYDLSKRSDVKKAVIEASGPVADWSDIDGIVEQWDDPTADETYLERVWLNRPVMASKVAFNLDAWDENEDTEFQPREGDLITIGFDGSKWIDATAVVATHVETGFQWLAGLWECPPGEENFEIPFSEVDLVISELFKKYKVFRMYADPPYWQSAVATWAGRYGDKVVFEWWTNRMRVMSYAIKSYADAIASGELLHGGDKHLRRHLANSVRKNLKIKDEDGKFLWVIYKETHQTPHKIDAAMASILSWEARKDAVSAGMSTNRSSVYEKRGLVSI